VNRVRNNHILKSRPQFAYVLHNFYTAPTINGNLLLLHSSVRIRPVF